MVCVIHARPVNFEGAGHASKGIDARSIWERIKNLVSGKETDRGSTRKARDAKPIDIGLGDAGDLDQVRHGVAAEPMRGLNRVARIGNGHRDADGDAFIALSG